MSKEAEKEELFRMADARTIAEAMALCRKWGFEPEGCSMALAIQAINIGRLRGEQACDLPHLQEHNGKLVEMALIFRERKSPGRPTEAERADEKYNRHRADFEEKEE